MLRQFFVIFIKNKRENITRYLELFSRISRHIFRDKIFCDICGQANAARHSALKMAGKFRRERTCEHIFIRREFFCFDLQMKKFWFTLQLRWVLALKVIWVSITNSNILNTFKKTKFGRKVDFYSYRKITFSDNKLQGQLFRYNFNVCWSSVRRISEQVSN